MTRSRIRVRGGWSRFPCVWKYHIILDLEITASPSGGKKGAKFDDNPIMSLDATAMFALMYARFAGDLGTLREVQLT